MDIYYFSFGIDHPLGGMRQPIIGTFETARERMFEVYGDKWCSQYTHADFCQTQESRVSRGLEPLNLLPLLIARGVN